MTVHAQAVKYRIFITTVNILHMLNYFGGDILSGSLHILVHEIIILIRSSKVLKTELDTKTYLVCHV